MLFWRAGGADGGRGGADGEPKHTKLLFLDIFTLFWGADRERRGADRERLGRKKKCFQLYGIIIMCLFGVPKIQLHSTN